MKMRRNKKKDELIDALMDVSGTVSHLRDTADDKMCEIDEVLEEARSLLERESQERLELQRSDLYQQGWKDAMASIAKIMEAGPTVDGECDE